MSQIKSCSLQLAIDKASSSWVTWSMLDIQIRIDLMEKWSELLSQQRSLDLLPAQMVNFHIKQALKLISEEQVMPGPTGESNVLTAPGRGVFVITAEYDTPETAFVGLIACALISGNCVVLSFPPEFQEIVDSLSFVLSLSEIERTVVQVIKRESVDDIISDPVIAGMAYVGNVNEAIRLNQVLASRDGQIAQFIIETDLTHLATLRDQCLILRFITEKTQTINLTAVGGNASLLALGCGDQ
ncbi:hypothetical protein N8878_01150 [Psychromonas sp.]|nr:hypothetical protein [Psychromonas sp.]